MGLALLSTLAAHDFGYLSLDALARRLGQSLQTIEQLERHQGHFYNWYDTRTLKPLPPLYLSTVDNGNLAALFLILNTGLLELGERRWDPRRPHAGLQDTLHVMREYAPDGQINKVLDLMERELAEIPASPVELSANLRHLLSLVTSPELRLSDPIPSSAVSPPSSVPDSADLEEETLTSAGTQTLAAAQNNSVPLDSASDFSVWRAAFERMCRDHQQELETLFPHLHLSERVAAWLRADPPSADPLARPLSSPSLLLHELWQRLNTPTNLVQLARGIETRTALADQLLTSLAGESQNRERIALVEELRQSVITAGQEAQVRLSELEDLAHRYEELARMDFALLYDSARELFAIGYHVTQHRLDASYYDLLASETRLASYVAIALGQVPQRHWFALGRLLTTADGKPTLISWSGSMFEYLMPTLIMPSYENTLLDCSCKSAVGRQIEYGRQMRVPWGMSESGYNLRDANANYQYRAFGVPGLGFKRGLAEDLVIAPYATLMALMVEPREAWRNLEELVREGAAGKYGLYEALDYTAVRVPRGQTHAAIQSFMAHHQGMSFLSLAYLLLSRPMQRRFNANPFFKSAELLLHERVPRETSVLYPHELEASSSRESASATEATLRVFTDPNAGPPEVHLLSNGRYHVMVTSAGGGYSRWNDLALTRWREDPTRDCWGTFFYLRDTQTGTFWSAAHQPTVQTGQDYEAVFSQGRAEFPVTPTGHRRPYRNQRVARRRRRGSARDVDQSLG